MARSEHPNPPKGELNVKRHNPKNRPKDIYKSSDTLCWRCVKSSNSGCSWSERFEPVEGWTAEETGIKMNGIIEKSYLVKECTEFERLIWKKRPCIKV